MADKRTKSDTMDLTGILEEAQSRRNMNSADGYAARKTPASSFAESDGFVIGGSSRPAKATKSRKPLIITLAAVGAVLAAGITGFILFRSSSGSSSQQSAAAVAGEVTVNGVNVGGMSYEEAKLALAPAEEKLADAIRIRIACGDKTLTLTKDDVPYSFNTDEILTQALQGGAADSYDIRVTVDDSACAAIAEKVAAEADRKAENAKVAAFNADKKDMFTYQEAVSGLTVDQDDLAAQLKKLFSDGAVTGSVAAKCSEAKPAYNADYLRQNIRRLSSFTTESTNTSNGMSNQALSLSACNSSIIEPGETWSFNACTGDSNLESRGYLPAGVIVQGRHEIGIGGGICQSSTTIYNAAILCGMEIVERECHYYPSSYVDYGRDATIDYGNIDLKLRNPFEHQLFLKCWMDGVILHAELYGLPEESFDEIKVSTTDPAYTSSSYTVKASRTYYKDGKAVRTEALPSSTYYFSAPSSETVAPTTAPTNPTTAPTNPGTQPSTDGPTAPPETQGGDTPSENPGEQPGGDPGEEPGGDPGENPGETGEEPGGNLPDEAQPGQSEP